MSVIIFSFLLFIQGNGKLFVTFSAIVIISVLSFDEVPYPIVFLFFDLGYWASVILVAVFFLTIGGASSELAKWTSVAAGLGCILYLPTILMGLGFWYFQGEGRVTDFLPFGFYGIRPWSHIATWLMPLTVGMLAMSSAGPLFRHRSWRNLLVIAAALWFAVLIGSGARGSLLAQILSGSLLFAFFGKKFIPIGRLWAVTFGLGLIFYVILIVVVPSFIFSATEDYSALRTGASGRLQLWGYALELSVRHFPMGAGPLSYISETPVSAFGTPHSLYFRWAAEYGWLFVAAFIGGMLWLGAPSWRKIRNASVETIDPFCLAIFWSVLAAFIHAAVSGVFTSPYSLVVGFPVLVVYFGYVLGERLPQKPGCLKLSGLSGVAAILFGFSIAMIPPMHAWYGKAKADRNHYVEEYQSPLTPRFWLHGRYTGEELKDQENTH